MRNCEHVRHASPIIAGLAGLLFSVCASPLPPHESASSSRSQLVITEGQTPFIDTYKPNALWTLPAQADEDVLALERGDVTHALRALREDYDVRVVVTEDECALYDALDTTPDIALWILSGHGNGIAVRLGDDEKDTREERYLDVDDTELALHARNLLPDAVTFAYTCWGGIGRDFGLNIANFLNDMTDTTVYSGTDEFGWGSIRRRPQPYPFAVDIYLFDPASERHGEDITYVVPKGTKR